MNDPKRSTGGRIRWLADHAEEVVSAALLLLMAILAFINVLVRYLSNYSFASTEELEASGLVYLTMFGAAAAFRRGLHLGLSFFYARLPLPLRRLVLLLSSGATIGIFAVISYYSIVQMRDEMLLHVLSEALEIPQWTYTLAIPVGSLFAVIRVIQRTVVLWGLEGQPSADAGKEP